MKKDIIRDFVAVVFFLGADYKQKFQPQFLGKILTVVSMVILTVIFLALSQHYGVFKFGFKDALDLQEILPIMGALLLVILIGYGIAAILSGGLILIPPMMMWFYISDKYGSKQHIINVFLFALCTTFSLYASNLVNIFEHLSGEVYHNTNSWGQAFEVFYSWVIMFGTWFVFLWLSGISKAWTHTVKEMIDLETAANSKKQKTTQNVKKRQIKS